jgi:predicted TIM-barrel fold metal-dependent hydrolase
MTTVSTEPQAGARRAKLGLIDCDVHNYPGSRDELKRHLPQRWHQSLDKGWHVGGHGGQVLGARPQNHVFRRDSARPGTRPGSDFELMREQLLEEHNIVKAIMIPLEGLAFPQYGELGAALARSVNEWNLSDWLEKDDRLYGSICVPVEDGARAAQEIERLAAHPKFVTVFVTMITREGLGHPKYWPIYEAAVEHGLPVMAHVGGFSGTHLAAGWPAYFVEQHTGYTQAYHAQIVSLVSSGVFDRFPSLQFCLQEGGMGWAAAAMWRLDRAWASMRNEEPQMTQRPSDVIREHFAFTTQPMDEPEKPAYLVQLIEHLGMNDRIMFSSDYPHWDFDDPSRIMPASLIGKELRQQIMFDNAERYWPW